MIISKIRKTILVFRFSLRKILFLTAIVLVFYKFLANNLFNKLINMTKQTFNYVFNFENRIWFKYSA